MLLEAFKRQGIAGLWVVDVPTAENKSLQIKMVSMYVLRIYIFQSHTYIESPVWRSQEFQQSKL